MSDASILDDGLAGWLDEASNSLDTCADLAADVLPRLVRSGLVGLAVAKSLGGAGGSAIDAVEGIAAVSERSLAAGFVLWGQRAFVEYLLQSPNEGLRAELLPQLLAGSLAGATGLSNAMKFLAGLEELQVASREEGGALVLEGKLPWATNLRPGSFHVAAAVSRVDGGAPFVASLSSDDHGLLRSPDLDLMALRGTNTAAISIKGLRLDPSRIIHPDGNVWLPAVRPAFLGLQCGMSIGLARRSLEQARACLGAGRSTLTEPVARLSASLGEQVRLLGEGLVAGTFRTQPAALFRIRIALAEIAAEAVGLELQGSGGRAYVRGPGDGFARRWREAAFIPIVTPSLVQLRTVLAAQRQSAA